MRRIRLITVDVTGTIFKFREPPSRVYKRFASDSGLECSHEALQDSLALNMRKMSKNYPNFGASGIGSYQWWKRVVHLTFQDACHGHYSEQKVEEFAPKLYNYYKEPASYTVYTDFFPFAKSNHKETKMVAISNFDNRLHVILNQLGISPFLSGIITSENAKCSKPDPDIFLNAVKSLGKGSLDPENILHIGDSPKKDYYAARQLGWNALLMERNTESIPPPSDIPQSDIISSFKDVSNWLNT